MKNQEHIYQAIHMGMKDGNYCPVPFTGDVNFSESEVVDRLLELFGNDNVEVIPRYKFNPDLRQQSQVTLDKAHIVTFHVTSNIEQKKWNYLKL